MNLVQSGITHRKAVLLLAVILMSAGVYAAFHLPSSIYPEVNFPRIVIVAGAGDLSTGNMMLAVTRPIEESVSGVQGLYRTRSRTIRGEAEFSLLFLPHTDMQVALQQVEARISEVRPVLPSETELTVERITPAVFPVLIFNLSGSGLKVADIYDYARYTISPVLSRIPGVGRVGVLGDTVREIEVIVDSRKLSANHLTLSEVEDAIRKANSIEAVGRLEKDYKQHLLLIASEIHAEEDIARVVLRKASPGSGPSAPLFVRDVAEVHEGAQDRQILISGNGQPSVQVNVTRQIGGNILALQSDVLQAWRGLERTLPPALKVQKVYDLAEFIHDSISSVRDAILLGCLLSVVILFFFLREFRATLIAALSIPVTLLITLFIMYLLGQTLNLMSLGGMAVAIGLVIDDAIVVVENIHRHLLRGTEGRDAAVIEATREILGAVTGSTFTTVVVFLPLGLVEGVVGQFFAAFSITLSAAVLVSLAAAFLLIPLLARRYMRAEGREASGSDRMMERAGTAYERLLRKALARPGMVMGFTVLLLAGGAGLFFTLGTGFLPAMDEGSFVLDYWMPAGTSLAESGRVMQQVDRILQDTPEVEGISRRTGAELGLFATEQSRGDVLVRLRKERSRRVEDIMDDVRTRIETTLPSVRIEFVQILQDVLGDLEGNPEPVEIKIFGDDPEKLQQAAAGIADKVGKIPGVVDLYNGIQQGNPEILVAVDPVRVQNAGLDAQEVSAQLSSALLGSVVTQYRQLDRLIGVRVRFADRERFSYDAVRNFPLLNAKTGQVVPLSSVAKLEEVDGQSELLRENQRQMIAVTARISGTSLGNVIPEVKRIVAAAPLPLGYSTEIGGQYESQQQSFRDLLTVLLIAVMLVLILLVLQFREFSASLVVLAAAPVSLVGALLMLKITGTEFNVSSFMGLIMLIGLIVKNGIILIEYTFQLEQSGMSRLEALVQAGRTRLRPILMTTLATLFGLLPLALGLGAGSEIQKPLALAVIGGLSLSMLVTLIFVPAVLVTLGSRRSS